MKTRMRSFKARCRCSSQTLTQPCTKTSSSRVKNSSQTTTGLLRGCKTIYRSLRSSTHIQSKKDLSQTRVFCARKKSLSLQRKFRLKKQINRNSKASKCTMLINLCHQCHQAPGSMPILTGQETRTMKSIAKMLTVIDCKIKTN